jgi:hypothetical protein
VPGTPLGTAVGYSRKHRVALGRFLDDPRLSPDNNAIERALRLVAVGRNNWLFAGSEDAARDAATLYTLIAGCRELGVSAWVRPRRDQASSRGAKLPRRGAHAARLVGGAPGDLILSHPLARAGDCNPRGRRRVPIGDRDAPSPRQTAPSSAPMRSSPSD